HPSAVSTPTSSTSAQQECSAIFEDKLGNEFVEAVQPLNFVLNHEAETPIIFVEENIEKQIDVVVAASEISVDGEIETEECNITDMVLPSDLIAQPDSENNALETNLDIAVQQPRIGEIPKVLEENTDYLMQDLSLESIRNSQVPTFGHKKSKLAFSSLSLKQKNRFFDGNTGEDSTKLSTSNSFKKRFGSFKKRDITSSGIISLKQADDDSISTCMSLYSGASVTGEIIIGFKYSNIENKLTIIVKNAKNLMIHDPKKDKNNAFVEIVIFPDQKSKTNKFRTKEVKGSHNSLWNEDFNYVMNPIDLKLRKVIVTVYHKSFPKKVFLGQVIIPMDETLNQIIQNGYIENSYSLAE
ncbi:hypothetical protein MXB_4888, partial [Myxobolus squamalis]